MAKVVGFRSPISPLNIGGPVVIETAASITANGSALSDSSAFSDSFVSFVNFVTFNFCACPGVDSFASAGSVSMLVLLETYRAGRDYDIPYSGFKYI